ncbi:MAG: hypothetical protein Q9M91_08950 [Candidatus Dojkabacteria bacterium]|nr:hypothetical protein [Candidatus Dojkabacteria bacterium]
MSESVTPITPVAEIAPVVNSSKKKDPFRKIALVGLNGPKANVNMENELKEIC